MPQSPAESARGAQALPATHGAGEPPTSAENPWPVRTVNRKVGDWIARLGWVWVEGQLTEVSVKPGSRTGFAVLRDTDADVSVRLTMPVDILAAVDPPVTDGARVVIEAKASFYAARGSMSLNVRQMRHAGAGALLQQLERLRRTLAAEGLFDESRKQPLPVLPALIGLVCGRNSDAEHDVVTNARLRWPSAQFQIENVPVQGPGAVSAIVKALQRLESAPEVEVIILTRGGGAFEDLLPFSDETLVRVVAGLRTPLISAIGHEQDHPIVDDVADMRASTPTDAARRVVPDARQELEELDRARGRSRQALLFRLSKESDALAKERLRLQRVEPRNVVERGIHEVSAARQQLRTAMSHRLASEQQALVSALARVHAASPGATLNRGYAIVSLPDGSVLRSAGQSPAGTGLHLRLADGEVDAVSY